MWKVGNKKIEGKTIIRITVEMEDQARLCFMPDAIAKGIKIFNIRAHYMVKYFSLDRTMFLLN